jgi:hypothetical protein
MGLLLALGGEDCVMGIFCNWGFARVGGQTVHWGDRVDSLGDLDLNPVVSFFVGGYFWVGVLGILRRDAVVGFCGLGRRRVLRGFLSKSDACWDARGSRSFWDLEFALVDGLAASFLLSFSLPVKDVLLLKLNAVEFGFPLAPGPLENY